MVYDLFHVIANYGREVIDPVRVDEANRLARLDELLSANAGLMPA